MSSEPTTVVVTDLDGSLWGTSLQIHDSTRAALAELDRSDIPVLVATGRRIGSAQAGLDDNGLRYPAVLLNGALGHDFATDTRFHEHLFPADDAVRVVEVFAATGHEPCMYTADGRVHVGGQPTTSQAHLDAVRDDVVAGDLNESARTEPVLGFSILGVEVHALKALASELADGMAEIAFYEDHLYQGWSLMVQPPGISKWTGVEAWFAHVGLERTRVIAIGDGGNDIELLEAADVSLAVTGGDPNALAVADEVLPHPDQGGWAKVLDFL